MEIDDLILIMPNQKSIERKTAAIMFTDIAGYTETMSKTNKKHWKCFEKSEPLSNH